MAQPDTSALMEELEQFKHEKEKIRKLVGQIGGAASTKRDRTINLAFIFAIVLLFVLDVLRHILNLSVPLPPLFSVEIGVFLVSIKIIWMIHKQTKVEHFQFWILNSIEFRLNDVSKRMRGIEDRLEK
ncbi:MAG: hypothetical protein DRP97_05975 [Candidatus Latescibacterota bacterium]|nr:hypothetical protein [Candidatus Latescibacterota bacterium]RKY68753.1 MAG: hypothetical protein DRP97_05975 [Candidatus Latescibacterota bacterium]